MPNVNPALFATYNDANEGLRQTVGVKFCTIESKMLETI